MPGTLPNEQELLRLLAGGSAYAFAQLFEAYRDRVYGLALKLCKSRPWAQEITQEVFLRVWVKREALSHVENFTSYVMTIARNRVWDELQNHAKVVVAQREFSESIAPSLNNPEEHTDYNKLLWQVIGEMPAQRQRVFKLAKIEGHSYEYIAKEMNLSHATVKNHMLLALQFLKSRLGPQLGSVVLMLLSL